MRAMAFPQNLRLVFSAAVLMALAVYPVSPALTFAEEGASSVIITWRARNFYPANFSGKALATPGSAVDVAAQVVARGKLTDATRASFTWYVDGKFLSRGDGVSETSFAVRKQPSDYHFVRVLVKLGQEELEATAQVPVSGPLLVIEAPYPNRVAPSNEPVTVRAIPYFFTVASLQELSFEWKVDQVQRSTGSDNVLRISLDARSPGPSTIDIVAAAQNQGRLLEFTRSSLRLTVP